MQSVSTVSSDDVNIRNYQTPPKDKDEEDNDLTVTNDDHVAEGDAVAAASLNYIPEL